MPENNKREQSSIAYDTAFTNTKDSVRSTRTSVLLMLDSLANTRQTFKEKYSGLKEIFIRTQLLTDSTGYGYLFPDRFASKHKEFWIIHTGEIPMGIFFYEYEDTTLTNNVKQNWLVCYGEKCEDITKGKSKQTRTDYLSAVTYVYNNYILHMALLKEINNSETDRWMNSISDVFKDFKSVCVKSFNFNKHSLQ